MKKVNNNKSEMYYNKSKISEVKKIFLRVLWLSCFAHQAFAGNFIIHSLNILADDDGPTLSDYASTEKACKEYLNGEIPDAQELKKIITELGDRLKAQYYWSSTVDKTCNAPECRIQVERSTLAERSENATNPSAAMICVSEMK